MYKLTNRNHYYNSNGMNNDPARSRKRGYHRENDRRISERIYNPGYDTSREYNKGDGYYDSDGDIYENEFVHDHDERDYEYRPERRNRNRRRDDDDDDNLFQRVGSNIRRAWNNLRRHDDPEAHYYYDDDELEARRQRTKYYADNDFDSVYNAADENSYNRYERRRRNPYDYQDEFDGRYDDFDRDRSYYSENYDRYNNYERGQEEFERDQRRNLRRRRARFSMDL